MLTADHLPIIRRILQLLVRLMPGDVTRCIRQVLARLFGD